MNQRSSCQHPLIIEKAREFKKKPIIHYCFIDYAKAFDCMDHKKLWKILQEMGIPDHLICQLQNLYAGQEATVRTGHGAMNWFKNGKGVHQGCILSPCLFNLHTKYIMWNAVLYKHKLESRLMGKYQWPQLCRWHHTYGKKQRWSKEPIDEGERGEWKSWLKTQHSKNEDGILSHHFTANRWGNKWKQGQTVLSWTPKSLQMVIAAMKLKDTCCLEEKLWQT